MALDVDILQAQLFIGPEQFAAVRRPAEPVFINVATAGNLAGSALALLAEEPDFVFAAAIGDGSDPASVRRPGAAAFVNAGCGGEVADLAVFGRDGEEVAAGAEEGALAVRGDFEVGNEGADIEKPGAAGGEVLGDGDRDGGGGAGGEIKSVDGAPLFEDNRLVAKGGKFYVIIGEKGELARLSTLGSTDVEVHSFVFIPVGEKIDPVS
ncbi:MAG: hypothetical protein BWY77_01257 [bacterium ADurb.Bin431]|nr:MAG: hypothetical protein BWY77_01257 [bacterium ADurb.Bin431]